MASLKALVLVALIAILMCGTSHAALTAECVPDGAYCGSYAFGLVVGKFNTTAGSDVFDIKLSGAVGEAECKNEKYIYDPKTHSAVVVDATDPNDCLGKLLTDNKLTLAVLFDPAQDVVTLDLGITVINCSKCETETDTTATPK